MISELTCVREASAPVVVFRLAGTLNVGSAATVRSALRKALVEGPSALLVDLGATRVADPLALTVFAAFAHTAAGWPGCPVMVCASNDPVRAELHRMAIDRAVPVYVDRAGCARRRGGSSRGSPARPQPAGEPVGGRAGPRAGPCRLRRVADHAHRRRGGIGGERVGQQCCASRWRRGGTASGAGAVIWCTCRSATATRIRPGACYPAWSGTTV